MRHATKPAALGVRGTSTEAQLTAVSAILFAGAKRRQHQTNKGLVAGRCRHKKCGGRLAALCVMALCAGNADRAAAGVKANEGLAK